METQRLKIIKGRRIIYIKKTQNSKTKTKFLNINNKNKKKHMILQYLGIKLILVKLKKTYKLFNELKSN